MQLLDESAVCLHGELDFLDYVAMGDVGLSDAKDDFSLGIGCARHDLLGFPSDFITFQGVGGGNALTIPDH